MDQLANILRSLTKPRYEEDFTDRLNYHITTIIILAAAFTIITKEYGGDPIQCWLPPEMASQRAWEQYAEDFCFIENTYYVPLDQNLPYSQRHRNEKKLTYYQWVPFTLMLQAAMFVVPHIVWRMLNWTAGIQTRAVITMACQARHLNPNSKEASDIFKGIANHLHQGFLANEPYKLDRKDGNSKTEVQATARIFGKYYLCLVYVIVKLLFILNSIIQYYIVSYHLGTNGFQLTKALMEQETWETTGLFPRVTMCDFKVRGFGNMHHYTIQCVLMANMFNEKIYIGLWWWFIILITINCCNLSYWLYVLFSDSAKQHFVNELTDLELEMHGEGKDKDNEFVNYLGGDGVLIMRLITQNAGDMIACNIAATLYDKYNTKNGGEGHDPNANPNKDHKNEPSAPKDYYQDSTLPA